mmetsp:Transcript_20028/g.76724  ORF Transcript_20028/g.76724 Transcript_20028/m.76724 type:complete len:245 (+) Transcript_20028:255-989(+)
MVQIHVGVAEHMREPAGLIASDVGKHVGESGVGGDVEWHAEKEVATPLVQLAVQVLVLAHIELRQQMARRQCHLRKVLRVPRRKQDPARVRVLPDQPYNLRQLVLSLATVVRITPGVCGTEVAPLKAIDGAEVAFFVVGEAALVEEFAAAVGIPEVDTPCLQVCHCRAARDEPQQLSKDLGNEYLLRGDDGQAVGDVKHHALAEEGARADPSPVAPHLSLQENSADEVEIGLLLRHCGGGVESV